MELSQLHTIPNIGKDPLHYVFEKNLVNSDGLMLEFGVFRGSSINYIASSVSNKPVYGFDSFEGLPESWGRIDMKFDKGAFNVDGVLPPVRENVKLIKGWFNESLPDFLKEHTAPITFLHIDCDLYSSTKTVFDLVKTQIADGCIIVFDELVNYPGFEQHEWKAWWEYVHDSSVSWEWIGMNGDIQSGHIRDRGAWDQKVAARIITNPLRNDK